MLKKVKGKLGFELGQLGLKAHVLFPLRLVPRTSNALPVLLPKLKFG